MTPDSKPGFDELQVLRKQIEQLEAQIADLKTRFPAHSLSPAMLGRLDELDESLSEARLKLCDWENAGKEKT